MMKNKSNHIFSFFPKCSGISTLLFGCQAILFFDDSLRLQKFMQTYFNVNWILSWTFRHTWPPRPLNLMPWNFMLWCYLKLHVYRVATGDYFFIILTTSISKKFNVTWRRTKKKLQLLFCWKSGSKSNKKIVACGNPASFKVIHYITSRTTFKVMVVKTKFIVAKYD